MSVLFQVVILASLLRLGGAFPGMVEVSIHIDRMILLDHLAKRWRNALRKDARDLGPEADDLNMRDFAQPFQNLFEHEVSERLTCQLRRAPSSGSARNSMRSVLAP